MTLITTKNLSPFAEAALKLDGDLTQFHRLAKEVTAIEVNSDNTLEKAIKLLGQFDECRKRIANGMQELGQTLEVARLAMEEATKGVADQADVIQSRQDQAQQMLERFKALGAMVRDVTAAVGQVCQKAGDEFSTEEKAVLVTRLPEFNEKLGVLVDEAKSFMDDARIANMKTLERSADALRQSLQSARHRLNLFVERNDGGASNLN